MFISFFLFVIACAFSSLFDDWRRSCEYVLLFFRLTVNNLYEKNENIRLGTLVACMCVLWGCEKPNVNIVMPQEASNRVLFAGEHLKKALEDAGYSSVMLSDTAGMDKDEVCIRLEQAADTAGLKRRGLPFLPVET